jgi:hypothetical protein
MKGNYTYANIFTDINNYPDHWWAPQKVLALLQGKNIVTTLILITRVLQQNQNNVCVYVYKFVFLPGIENRYL